MRDVQSVGQLLFKAVDSNNDGQISQREALAAANLIVGGYFFRADTNGDGVISPQEWQAAREELFQRRPWLKFVAERARAAKAAGGGVAGANPMQTIINMIDTNQDKNITAAEVRQTVQSLVQTAFATADTNHDGQLSPMEVNAAALGAAKAAGQVAFQAADKDHNGQISEQEFLNALRGPAITAFAILDANNDHQLSPQELQSAERVLWMQMRALKVPEQPNSPANLLETGRRPEEVAPVPTITPPTTSAQPARTEQPVQPRGHDRAGARPGFRSHHSPLKERDSLSVGQFCRLGRDPAYRTRNGLPAPGHHDRVSGASTTRKGGRTQDRRGPRSRRETIAMRCRTGAGLLGLAALVGTLTARAGDEGLPPAIVPHGFGVNIHFTNPRPGEMERFAEAGYRFARMDFGWGSIERTKGQYDFSAYDRLTAELAKVGARPLYIFDYGNRLYDEGLSPHSAEARAAFARYAAAAAKHFQGKGVVWEILERAEHQLLEAQAQRRRLRQAGHRHGQGRPRGRPRGRDRRARLEHVPLAVLRDDLPGRAARRARRRVGPPLSGLDAGDGTRGLRSFTFSGRSLRSSGEAGHADHLVGVGLLDVREGRQRGATGPLPGPAVAGEPVGGREPVDLL